MAQSVKHPISVSVMISRFVGSSPTLGSMLTAQSLELAWDSVCPSLSLPLPHSHSICLSIINIRAAWVAQLVERPTSAQVMISQLVGLSPASGSVLTAQSLEPVSDSMSPSLSAPPPLSLSQK